MARLALFFILLSSISLTQLFSQNSSVYDSLITGKSYKFVMYDETEITGKVTGVNDKQVKLITESGAEYVLNRDNILYYSTDITQIKNKFSLSLLGGVSVMTSQSSYYYSGGKPQTGLNIDLAGIFYLSETKAVKIDFGYNFLKAIYDNGYVMPLIYPYYPSTHEGGDLSSYSLKGNGLLGWFNPKDNISFYGSLGFGFNLIHQNEIKENYYNYNDSSYHTNIYNPKNDINAILSIGCGMIFRLSGRLGIHAEIEYHLITNDENYFYFYRGNSYFPIRAGIKYSIF